MTIDWSTPRCFFSSFFFCFNFSHEIYSTKIVTKTERKKTERNWHIANRLQNNDQITGKEAKSMHKQQWKNYGEQVQRRGEEKKNNNTTHRIQWTNKVSAPRTKILENLNSDSDCLLTSFVRCHIFFFFFFSSFAEARSFVGTHTLYSNWFNSFRWSQTSTLCCQYNQFDKIRYRIEYIDWKRKKKKEKWNRNIWNFCWIWIWIWIHLEMSFSVYLAYDFGY